MRKNESIIQSRLIIIRKSCLSHACLTNMLGVMGEALPEDDLHSLLKFVVSDQLRIYLRQGPHTHTVGDEKKPTHTQWFDCLCLVALMVLPRGGLRATTFA